VGKSGVVMQETKDEDESGRASCVDDAKDEAEKVDVAESRESERDSATEAIIGEMLDTGDEKYMASSSEYRVECEIVW